MTLPIIPQPVRVEELPGRSAAEVTLVGSTDPSLGNEGYELHITPAAVTLAANSPAGIFYGQQTLRQLRADDGTVLCARIWDKPRFGWRGLMLDVARHFFTKTEIKHFLDVMAVHKLNVFHWHLDDTQSWRLEIKKYPRLTEIGAWREKIEWGLDSGASRAWNAAGQYGGFYTQADVREIVAYAADRHITIVPEIEMPGHSRGALTAHPEFSCNGTPHSGVFCAGNDATFEFLQNILTEVLALFPSQFIHIGGDEVPKDFWKSCPRCQQRSRAEGLQNEEELQSYFIRRIEKFINANGRRLVGWDEILEGGLAPNATVMSWRGMAGGIAAATAGHDVVMTPTAHCYLDLYQGAAGQPQALGGYVPLEQAYAFEPIPPEIPTDKIRHILGGGGNLWTEYMPNYGHVQFMAYPRACALAEALWSPKENRNFADFNTRLKVHTKLLDALGVTYARTME